VKVKWDGGKTSYFFRRDEEANVKERLRR